MCVTLGFGNRTGHNIRGSVRYALYGWSCVGTPRAGIPGRPTKVGGATLRAPREARAADQTVSAPPGQERRWATEAALKTMDRERADERTDGRSRPATSTCDFATCSV